MQGDGDDRIAHVPPRRGVVPTVLGTVLGDGDEQDDAGKIFHAGELEMTPKEATAFRKACQTIRKHIPDDNETPAMFELVVTRIVAKALEELE